MDPVLQGNGYGGFETLEILPMEEGRQAIPTGVGRGEAEDSLLPRFQDDRMDLVVPTDGERPRWEFNEEFCSRVYITIAPPPKSKLSHGTVEAVQLDSAAENDIDVAGEVGTATVDHGARAAGENSAYSLSLESRADLSGDLAYGRFGAQSQEGLPALRGRFRNLANRDFRSASGSASLMRSWRSSVEAKKR